MTERIRWEPTEPGGDDSFGYVGTLDRAVFTLWFPREDGVSWAVSAAIPGTGQEDAECRWGACREEAAAEAERWLSDFVSSLGAVFPESWPVTSRCECGGQAQHQLSCRWREGYGSRVITPTPSVSGTEEG